MPRHANPFGINLFALGDEGQGILGIGNLVKAANLATRAFALAATAEIDAERTIAHILDHPRDKFDMRLVLGAHKAVQHDEGWQFLARLAPCRNVQHARQLEAV